MQHLFDFIGRKSWRPYAFSHHPTINDILILTFVFVPWLLTFGVFRDNILYVAKAFTGLEGGLSVANEMGGSLSKLNINGFDLLSLLIKMLGQDIIFLVLAIVGLLILFKYPKERARNKYLMLLMSSTFVIGLLYVGYIFNLLGLRYLAGDRLILGLMLFTPIAVGFVFGFALNSNSVKSNKSYLIVTLYIALIMIASIASIFNVYLSPYVSYPNVQVTHQDMQGMSWLINCKNKDIDFAGILSPPCRYADALIGHTETGNRTDLTITGWDKSFIIPDHFNYTAHETLKDSYQTDRYVAITKFDRTVYNTVWRSVGRFKTEDFEKLNEDKSVNKLYSNGGLDVWYI